MFRCMGTRRSGRTPDMAPVRLDATWDAVGDVMRIIELVGTCLTVEFSDEDLTELSEDFDVTLPGRFIRIPGRLTDVFCAYGDEVRVSKHASGPFVVLDPQGGPNYPVTEMICSQWPEFDVDCDIRCYGMDGELWCCNTRGFTIVVAAPRLTWVLWAMLAVMIAAAEICLTVVLMSLEGVYGALFITLMLAPFVVGCAAYTLYCCRFRVEAGLRGVTVRPVFGGRWRFALSDIVRIDRDVGRGSAGIIRRLTIHTAERSVTVRGALAGVNELDVFLTTYCHMRNE